jgi:putative ABC transport system substrate-binding protein
VPTVKNVGFVYSPGEVNSTIVLKELQEVLDKDGIKVVAAPAQRTTDISTAVKSLQGRVDVIYTSTDNNVVSAYESMYQAAVQTKIPLIASDTSSAERGAVAALGGDYYGMGRQTGKLVVRILEGEKAGDIPSEKPQKTQLYVNVKAAKQQGATLPQSMIDSATKVIE